MSSNVDTPLDLLMEWQSSPAWTVYVETQVTEGRALVLVVVVAVAEPDPEGFKVMGAGDEMG
jgi:hypothetical protein